MRSEIKIVPCHISDDDQQYAYQIMDIYIYAYYAHFSTCFCVHKYAGISRCIL